GEFTSRTITLKLFVTLNCGLAAAAEFVSRTTTVTKLLDGPWASPGVHEIAPEVALMVIPVGADSSAKVSGFAGTSGSVAVAETLSGVSSSIVCVAGTVSCGGAFSSRTVTVNVLVALNCWLATAPELLS